MKVPTIKDVAVAANVSTQTVSRVVNNVGYVKEETREKVMRVIREMQYYPNATARSLKANRCNVVGLSFPDDIEAAKNNMFYIQIISQISSICHENGYSLIIVPFDIHTDPVENLIGLYRKNIISGVIITSPSTEETGLNELQESGLPFVFIGTPPEMQDECYVDNCAEKLVSDAVEYLIDRGHTRIAFINGPAHMTLSRDSLNGYTQVLKKHGLPFDSHIVKNVQLHVSNGSRTIEEIRRQSPDVTAVICADDLLAIGVLKASSKMGMRVPEDLSLLSLCYNDWNSYIYPAITGYKKNNDLLGKNAIHMLLSRIYGKNDCPKAVTIPHVLVEGKSCGPAKTV